MKTNNKPILDPNLNHWPYFSEDEVQAVAEVVASGKVNYWTGPHGKTFEKEFANYFGAKYAIALANGTLALELALRALDIGPGDEVIVPSRTFIATASAVVMVGAIPVVADVDTKSQNVTVETIKPLVTKKTKAIIVVHLGGWPCDMESIMAFAKQNHLKVIEDCAQAIGAKWNNKYVGTFGDISAFSFCQDKIITSGGEGGMITTDSTELWEKMWAYKDHGKDFYLTTSTDHPPGFRWLHNHFGSNYRMTEMQAVIGRIQLNKLSQWVEKRNENAKFLLENFKKIDGLITAEPEQKAYNAYYRLYVSIEQSKLKPDWNRDKIMSALNNLGIPCFVGSCSEIYLEKAFAEKGFGPKERLPNAKWLSENSLVFLVHPTLEKSNLEMMVEATRQVMNSAKK